MTKLTLKKLYAAAATDFLFAEVGRREEMLAALEARTAARPAQPRSAASADYHGWQRQWDERALRASRRVLRDTRRAWNGRGACADEEAMLAAIRDTPHDQTPRLVYADRLGEHDRPEDATRMRHWAAARAWVDGWLKAINYKEVVRGADGEPVYDDATYEYKYVDDPHNLGYPHTFSTFVEAGIAALTEGGYSFNSDDGADWFREAPDSRYREFFDNWTVITGVVVRDHALGGSP